MDVYIKHHRKYRMLSNRNGYAVADQMRILTTYLSDAQRK